MAPSTDPFVVVIPARLASSRLPDKPLVPIAGRPLIAHVVERARESRASRVIVAADDERVLRVARDAGAEAVFTDADLPSGTDRIAAVAAAEGWGDESLVVNLQGDEPLTPGDLLDDLAALLAESPEAEMATLGVPLTSPADLHDPNQVKLVTDDRGRALYFSRAPIPFDREAERAGRAPDASAAVRHLGLYAYRAGFLRRMSATAPSRLEQLEQLEQLRALAMGAYIRVGLRGEAHPPGVDTPADVQRVEAALAGTANS